MRRTKVEFLRGRAVWLKLRPLVANGSRTRAAISYFAKDGARLLPLKTGDRLVVDMSLGAVRQGVTDPREIKKLIDGGVDVFSRSHLHAKFVVTDGWLMTGSMNVSHNSVEVLDEAAPVTNEPGAVAAARRTIAQWSGEPVFPHQLEQAIEEYRPPTFKAIKAVRRSSTRRGNRARLWIVAGLHFAGVPEAEQNRAEVAERKAGKAIRRRRATQLSFIQFGQPNTLTRSLRAEDWIIPIVNGRVDSPARVAGVTSYSRGSGKRRWLIVTEEHDSQLRSWTAFKRAAKRSAGLQLDRRRTLPIADQVTADHLRQCWSWKTGKPLARFFNP